MSFPCDKALIDKGAAKDTAGLPAFEESLYRWVAAIPQGKVISYGQLALLAGNGRWARKAGRAMALAPEGLPCHRVVNSAGRTVPGWTAQRRLLQAEGVAFKQNGCVDMKKHRWQLD